MDINSFRKAFQLFFLLVETCFYKLNRLFFYAPNKESQLPSLSVFLAEKIELFGVNVKLLLSHPYQ